MERLAALAYIINSPKVTCLITAQTSTILITCIAVVFAALTNRALNSCVVPRRTCILAAISEIEVESTITAHAVGKI